MIWNQNGYYIGKIRVHDMKSLLFNDLNPFWLLFKIVKLGFKIVLTNYYWMIWIHFESKIRVRGIKLGKIILLIGGIKIRDLGFILFKIIMVDCDGIWFLMVEFCFYFISSGGKLEILALPSSVKWLCCEGRRRERKNQLWRIKNHPGYGLRIVQQSRLGSNRRSINLLQFFVFEIGNQESPGKCSINCVSI